METSAAQCCPLADGCSFFHRSKNYMPHISEQLKEEYCMKDNRHCACLRVHNKLGAEWVPLNMMPYHHGWAETIFEQLDHRSAAFQAAHSFGVPERF